MRRRALFSTLAMLISLCASVRADESPTSSGRLSPSETAFVKSIQADLPARFAHAADAEKAGYVRYTNVDASGAISYANMQWTSQDIRHPSQLWYDKNGDLLGADFSVPNTDGKRPHLFGVSPGRWYAFEDHVHYVLRDTTSGKMKYDLAVSPARFREAGGDPAHPTAATLVRMGKAKSESQVATVFDFPAIWDLIVWVKPNPDGAFAEKNPLVKS
ncbi:MAG: hypothetical protein DLM53_00580 [Candidatus Eremiobacter antarcticus]|nr:MAG: hypothetical protein DLM53_00580 [Candidatus Eremiobacter sp. RRmetagenome_bin22]